MTGAARQAPTAEILPASWRDVRELWALEKITFGRDAWSLLELLISLVGTAVRIKAVADGRIIGFVIAEPRRWQGLAWIAAIAVHPNYRRRGLGRRLLSEAEARLSAPLLKLTVRRSNAAAIALYEQFGYAAVKTLGRYYPSGEDGIVMEKRRGAPA